MISKRGKSPSDSSCFPLAVWASLHQFHSPDFLRQALNRVGLNKDGRVASLFLMSRETVDPEKCERKLLGGTMMRFEHADRRATSFWSSHPATTVDACSSSESRASHKPQSSLHPPTVQVCPAGESSCPYQGTVLNKLPKKQWSGKQVVSEPPQKDSVWLLRNFGKPREAYSILSSSSA